MTRAWFVRLMLVCLACLGISGGPAWAGGQATVGLGPEGKDPAMGNGGNACSVTSSERTTGADFVYRIVQFDGPVEEQWKKSLAGLTEVFDYVPQFAFMVRVPVSNIRDLCDMPHVRWVGLIGADMKLGSLGVAAGSPDSARPIRVTLFPGESPDPVAAQVEAMGGRVQAVTPSSWGTSLSVFLPADKAAGLAEYPAVRRVERIPEHKTN